MGEPARGDGWIFVRANQTSLPRRSNSFHLTVALLVNLLSKKVEFKRIYQPFLLDISFFPPPSFPFLNNHLQSELIDTLMHRAGFSLPRETNGTIQLWPFFPVGTALSLTMEQEEVNISLAVGKVYSERLELFFAGYLFLSLHCSHISQRGLSVSRCDGNWNPQ